MGPPTGFHSSSNPMSPPPLLLTTQQAQTTNNLSGIHIPGYKLQSLLYQIPPLSVYRAKSPSDADVLLKVTFPGDANAVESRSRLRYEWHLFSASSLMSNISGVLRPTAFEMSGDDIVALVYPDEGLQPLYSVYRVGEIAAHPINELLTILNQLRATAKVIEKVHRRGIMHGNINSMTIFLSQKTVSSDNSGSVTEAGLRRASSTTVILDDSSDSNGTPYNDLTRSYSQLMSDDVILLGGFELSAKMADMQSPVDSDVHSDSFLQGSNASSSYFGFSSVESNPHLFHHNMSGGMWEYKAPEWSGRVNRGVDWRGDLYALGVVMYELCVGVLPFQASDYLELVHKHIADMPRSPSEVSFAIPHAISEVILKLLEKNPEDRYQTARGVIADLDYIIERLELGNTLSNFKVGLTDTDSQFHISEQLFGRESDVEVIFETYRKVTETGGCAMALVSGSSGVGKSRLAHEIRRLVGSNRGYFTMGKFDQYKREVPFISLVQALQDLIRQVLAESETSLQKWRSEALRSLEADAVTLVDIVPELRLLLGDTPMEQPTDLGYTEREIRFKRIFSAFMSIFAQRGLVLFLDDLQWCSRAEFELIHAVAENMNTKQQCALIIGSYRDGEITPDHPLETFMKRLKNGSIPVSEIHLQNLTIANVTDIIADTMRMRPGTMSSDMQMLARLTHARTEGNTFFVVQLLKSLYRSGHIYFDFHDKAWRFNFRAIQPNELPLTVIDLLVSHMSKLEASTRRILTVAACLGSNDLTIRSIAMAAGVSAEDALTMIWPSLKAGLLLSTNNSYSRTDSSRSTEVPNESDLDVTYRFLHDRVQQAAYSLVPDSKKAQLHYTLGKRLLTGMPNSEAIQTHIYDIVSQFNRCLEIIPESERGEIKKLNLWAGRRALSFTAFEMALNYIRIANSMIPENGWQEMYASTFEIRLGLAEAYYAVNRYTQSLDLINSCLGHITIPTDKARMHLTKVNCLLALGHFSEAITTGLDTLSLLGNDIITDDESMRRTVADLRGKISLSPKEISAVRHRPFAVDANMLLVQEVVGMILLPIYMSSPHWLEYVCFISAVFSLQNGISAAGAYPLLMTGVILGSYGGEENHHRSYAYGKLAVSIIEECKLTPWNASGVYEVYAGHIGCFHQPMSEVSKYLNLAVTTGLSTSNADYTMFASVELCTFAFFAGENLPSVASKLASTEPLIAKLHHAEGIVWLNMGRQVVANLREGLSNDSTDLDGKFYDEALRKEALTTQSVSSVYVYHLFRCINNLFFNKIEDVAVSIVEDLEPRISAMRSTYYQALADFMTGLVFGSCGDKLTPTQSSILNRAMKNIQEHAVNCPSTFGHKALIMKAEVSRAGKDYFHTLDLYDDAIQLALKNRFLHEAALCAERCGKWLYPLSPRRAKTYIREAHRLYTLWGADAKSADLASHFPNELGMSRRQSEISDISRPPHSRNTSNEAVTTRSRSPRFVPDSDLHHELEQHKNAFISGHRSIFYPPGQEEPASASSSAKGDSSLDSDMDLKFVLKASLVISEGSSIEEVIYSLMSSVLQAAGADYGVLMIEEKGAMYLETVGLLSGVTILGHEPLNSRPDIVPISIVNIVSGLDETIVKSDNDWRFENLYGKDPYFANRVPRSVLCMPISNQLRKIGALYLENKRTSHAFSSQRLELLNILCTQAAVTIEKARLLQEMALAKKAAEEATAEKASFLANMSHEIRTPFNALLSCSIFLLDTQLSIAQRDYVETIRNSATLTLEIIDDILDYSKIEHGTKLETTQFSIGDCIESALQLIAEPAATKNLEIGFRSRNRDIDIIYGDVTRLRQVIINLLGNAVKFTSEGSIVVEMRAEKFASEDNRYQIKITVRDTGIGIPKAAYGRLFRAFSQVDSSTRRAYGGTGLGLAISKKLVEMMGGRIWLESEEGVGTTFNFTIVCKASHQKPTQLDASLRGKRCLLADSYPISTSILRDELVYDGLQVHTARDLQRTIEAVLSHPAGYFRLALIDASIDETLRVAGQILHHDPKLAVVMICRFGVTLPTKASEFGITGFLCKPLQRARLLQTIENVCHLKKHPPNEVSVVSSVKEKEQQELLKTLGNRHPLKILLAEDNPINLKVALQHLKRMGYNADHAKDGIEALEMCERADPMYDVILMDIQMPRCDGIETSLRIREQYAPRERPAIIALTANATTADRDQCLRAGMERHLPKPILPNDLAAALMSVAPLTERDAS